jgi:threonine dehydrogenase-like Zn-dependent dehydrogenase
MERKLVCTGVGMLEVLNFDPPALMPGQIRIKAEYGAAKHGTEMAFYKGYANERGAYDNVAGYFIRGKPANPYPFSIGNMVVGEVTEVAADVQFAVGDRVLAYSGFSTYAVADAKASWKLPAHVSWQSAVCIDPADFAFSAVRDGHVRIGDAVAIFSLGAIGLQVIQMLVLAGAYPIIAFDPIERRRQIAMEYGATLALDPTRCDAGAEIRNATGGRGADVVIEYSGTRPAMQDALRGVAFGGNVVSGAFPPAYNAGLDFGAESHMNIPNIIFSRACSDPNRDHPRWDNDRIYAECFRLIIGGRLDGKKIVWPVVGFDELITAYPEIAHHPETTMKLGVRYQ